MNPLGTLHLASAVLALVAGGWILLRRKGTVSHRRIGWLYAGSMLTLNVTALLIYRLTGVFGPFHIAALISLGTLAAGVLPVRRRGTNWLEHHYFFMSYSYLGLLAAAVAETATRVPAIQIAAGGPGPLFWGTVALVSVLVFVVGGRVIRGRVDRTLTPFR